MTGFYMGSVSLTDEMTNRAECFVYGQSDSAEYRVENRAAPNVEKASRDDVLGKEGEEGFKIIAEAYGLDVGEIDYERREGSKKGWKPDFVYGGDLIHVKTVEPWGDEYLVSWSFSKNESGERKGTDPLFYKGTAKDWVALCVKWHSKIYLAGFLNWEQAKDYFAPPRRLEKRPFKSCLYFKDLKRAYL